MIAAADLLAEDFGVQADLWSAPSFNELKRDGDDTVRWNLLHPDKKPRLSHVEQCLVGTEGPVVAATDYVKLYADQIRAFVPRRYVALGTDGFGRSESREALRDHFEVDARFITLGALSALAREGQIECDVVKKAMEDLEIDPEKNDPAYL